MTSDRQLKANRTNARASTGPRSAQGKARASQNALRHALSVSIHAWPELSREVENLVREIAGDRADGRVLECARRVAEAQIDLLRVRQARQQLMSNRLNDPNYKIIIPFRVPDPVKIIARNLKRLLIYERDLKRYLNGETTRIPVAPEITPLQTPELWREPKGDEKIADILYFLTTHYAEIDRYERRALSRSKISIRELDDLRQQIP